MPSLTTILKQLLRDVVLFSEHASGLKLRNYQVDVAQAIADSVIFRQGLTFVVIFPRQSGKNELQAQIECYLLTLLAYTNAEIVKISPTWKPQSLNAMRRLERVLKRNLISRGIWHKESGYIYCVEQARIFFLSGSPTANVVGATASTLLECDEAQDVQISKWDKDVLPMAASTNATRVYWGTAWTSRTLLAREMRAALQQQKADGIRRVFRLTADDVRKEVKAYGVFVDGETAKLGRNHPMIRTQFYSEEIDAESGMLNDARLALMAGSHPRQRTASPGRLYALLIDVAGEDEGVTDVGADGRPPLQNAGRDSTALTVIEIDLSGLADDLIHAPIYRIVDRKLWTGVKHTSLYGELKSLAESWEAKYLVVDATGVGAGLTSFLKNSLGERVIPFIFSSSSKSKLGWDFLSVIESGRLKDWRRDRADSARLYGQGSPWDADERAAFQQQARACQMEILTGPERRMKWGVPDGTRDPRTGELIHDDLILSAALVSVLDALPWGTASSQVIKGIDPLEGMTF